MKKIGEQLIESIHWEDYCVSYGSPLQIPTTLYGLLEQSEPEPVKTLYFQLENLVVSQGSVETAAIPVARVLVAALLDERSFATRVSIFNLFYQILAGGPAEPNNGHELMEHCRKVILEGIWIIIREFKYGPRNSARDVLSQLGTDIDYEMFCKE